LRLKRSILIVAICALAAFAVQRFLFYRPVNPVVLAPLPSMPTSETPSPPVRHEAPTKWLAAAADINEDFHSSSDYFDFVSKTAKKAFDGDGRAALYISKVLQTCMVVTKLYGQSNDPETAFNAEWAAQPHAPSWLIESARKDFHACHGFFNGDAFATLPDRPGGYNSSSYWVEQAYKDKDPIALALHAGSEIAKSAFIKSGGANTSAMESAQLDINEAAMSGDPAALFRVGSLISNGHGNDPIQGFAVSIAACDLGYDCSVNNGDNYGLFGACVASGTCPSGTTYSDVITQSVGPGGHAEAYARAQQIENALSRGDANALQPFVQLKR
jgi:hypothetical protein